VRESRGFEHRLAVQQSDGIGSTLPEQRFPRGEGGKAGAPFCQGGARLGAAGWRELQHAIGPGDQAVPMHTSGFGAPRGGSEAREPRVGELARDAATRRHQGRALGVIVIAPLEHSGDGMGEIVNRGACQPLLLQEVDGCVQIACAVLEGRGGAAHDSDEAPEPLGEACTRPGRGHRHCETPPLLQARGRRREVRVRGVKRHDRHDLPGPQGEAAIDHPDQPRGKRRSAHRDPLEHPGCLEADHGASRSPMDHRLRAWRLLDAQGHSEEAEDARDGAQADASHQKQRKGEEDQVHLVGHGTSMALRLARTQTRLGLFAGVGGAVSLVCAPSQLLALVTIVIGSLYRLMFPWMAALFDVGSWAHDALAGQETPPRAAGDDSGRWTLPKRIACASAVCTGKASVAGGPPLHATRQGDRMTDNRMEAKPMAGAHGRLCGEASAPCVKTECWQQWICCDTAFGAMRGGGRCP